MIINTCAVVCLPYTHIAFACWCPTYLAQFRHWGGNAPHLLIPKGLAHQQFIWANSSVELDMLSNCPQAWSYYHPFSSKIWGPLANCRVSTYTKQVWGHRSNLLQIHALKSPLISSVLAALPLEIFVKFNFQQFQNYYFFYSSSKLSELFLLNTKT